MRAHHVFEYASSAPVKALRRTALGRLPTTVLTTTPRAADLLGFGVIFLATLAAGAYGAYRLRTALDRRRIGLELEYPVVFEDGTGVVRLDGETATGEGALGVGACRPRVGRGTSCFLGGRPGAHHSHEKAPPVRHRRGPHCSFTPLSGRSCPGSGRTGY